MLESQQVSALSVPVNMSEVLPHPLSLSLDLRPIANTPSILSVRSPIVSHRGVNLAAEMASTPKAPRVPGLNLTTANKIQQSTLTESASNQQEGMVKLSNLTLPLR